MTSRHIPNLNTFRRGPVGRGRGAPGASAAGNDEEDRAAKDRIVQQTDQDASVSRLSAVEVGYLDDPFAQLFVSADSQRRFPIINRGTYVRTKAIDDLVHRFLSASTTHKQIISLGAGSDTRFFRLTSHDPPFPPFLYHELDFPTNTAQKISAITRSNTLSELIHDLTISQDHTSLSSSTYHIHPIDLRNLNTSTSTSTTANPPSLQTINPSLPTLLLSECCLIYLTPHHADTAALYFTSCLFPPTTPLALILYEPINPHDPFGKVMVSNLAARGIVLQTLRKYGSLDAQRERLKGYGFSGGGGARTVDEIWEGVGREEKERVGGLEMVDEVEEWRLLAGHYCVAWGWRDGDGEGEGKRVWDGWREMEQSGRG